MKFAWHFQANRADKNKDTQWRESCLSLFIIFQATSVKPPYINVNSLYFEPFGNVHCVSTFEAATNLPQRNKGNYYFCLNVSRTSPRILKVLFFSRLLTKHFYDLDTLRPSAWNFQCEIVGILKWCHFWKVVIVLSLFDC